MANITGVNPPILNDVDYVDKIKNSIDAIDAHDHTTGKGVAIGTSALATGSVTADKLASDAVTTIKILDGAVTAAKIAANQVVSFTSARVASGVLLTETGGGTDAVTLVGPAATTGYSVVMPGSAPTPNTGLVYDGANFVWSSAGGWTTFANENISGSGSITSSTTIGQQLRRVTGNGAAVTVSTTPFGAVGGWQDGLVIRLVGQSSTDTVTIEHNDIAKGAILNGSCVLGQYDAIELQYDSTADRWIEITRSVK
jgi:hypothetical protein